MRFESAVVQRRDEFASTVRRVVHLPEPLEERDDRRNPPSEHQGVFAPLDLQGAPLVLADRLQPRPCLVQGASDQPRVPVDVREFRIRVSGEFEQAVERAASERLDLRARVAQQPHERIGIGAGRRRGDADPPALAGVEEERDCEVRPGPRQEIQIRRGRHDVPREDPHLAPVVDFALADETVDPLAIPIQGAVEDARDPLDFLAGPPDRFEELRGLRLEGLRGRLIAGRHENDAMEPRAYLGSFGRLSKPRFVAISYNSGKPSRVPWESSRTSVTSYSRWMTWRRPSPSTAICSGSAWSAKGVRSGR